MVKKKMNLHEKRIFFCNKVYIHFSCSEIVKEGKCLFSFIIKIGYVTQDNYDCFQLLLRVGK